VGEPYAGFPKGALSNPFGQGGGQSHHREVEHCASEAPCIASLLATGAHNTYKRSGSSNGKR